MYLKWTFLFCIAFFAITCTESEDEKRYRQLREEVLSHYKMDKNPLKIKAASFLLDNLKDRYAVNGERYDAYSHTIKTYYKEHTDTLINKLKLVNKEGLDEKYELDINTLSTSYLIDNIDRAFSSLDRAGWKKDVSFNDFCEYILPYRVGNEPLEYWRKEILQDEKLNMVSDTLFTFTQLRESATWLSIKQSKDRRRFHLIRGESAINLPDLPYSTLNLLTAGRCSNLTQLSLFACRAAAIPIANDFTPHWGNFKGGHDWVAVITKSGIIPFVLPIYDDTLGVYSGADEIAAKVYRHTFSENKESHLKERGFCNFLPPVFNNSRLIDVTDSYHLTYDINVPVAFKQGKDKFAYLAVANRENWIPVGWGKQKNGMANFPKAVVNCVYLPMFVSKIKTHYFTFPFILSDKGEVRYLQPDHNKLQRVELLRKHPLKFEILKFVNRMIGGKFQVANNKEFKNPVTVYTINESPGVYYNDVEVNLSKKYRYVRFLTNEKSYCDVAEIEFYERNNDRPIQGKIMGSYSNLPLENAFDGDVLTYFHSSQPINGYIGMDMGEAKDISKIRFVSRNDKNHIIPGHLYELFYWENEWKSLGQQTATGKVLVYDKVPSNCLFLLKNHTEGKEERIFTYENGQQVWR